MQEDSFYFFSTERYSPELPVKCHFVKQLLTDRGREAILTKCIMPISAYETDYLLVISKYAGENLLSNKLDEPVFTYVLDGREFVDKSERVHASNQKIIDWGGVTKSYDKAKKWQVKEKNYDAIANIKWLSTSSRHEALTKSVYPAIAKFVDQNDELSFQVFLKKPTPKMLSEDIWYNCVLDFSNPLPIIKHLRPGQKLLITEKEGIIAECYILDVRNNII